MAISLKATFLLTMLLWARTDRLSLFGLPEAYERRTESGSRLNGEIKDFRRIRGHQECQLPKEIFEGPLPLQTEVEWRGFCPEHHRSLALMPVGYHGRPFLLQKFQNRWASLEIRIDKVDNLSSSERTEATALALVLALYHLNAHHSQEQQRTGSHFSVDPLRQSGNHPATSFVRYLHRAAHQWPQSLNKQWPVLEWIMLEYWCQNASNEKSLDIISVNNDVFIFSKENRPALESESASFWLLINAYKRYEWAMTEHRPMDALAYYRESHFHHESLLASLWKQGGDYRSKAMNASGELRNFWLGIALLGVLSVMLWGWSNQHRLKPIAGIFPTALAEFSKQDTESQDQHISAGMLVINPITPLYADLSVLWNSKLHTNQQWEDFKTEYNRCIPGFLPNLRLEYPRLTQSDIRLACLIRMGMTSSEISRAQNISSQGVAMARYRLRKRMGLGREDSIPDRLNAVC